MWKTSIPLWKKLNSSVEKLGNQWGKVGIKIRIAKLVGVKENGTLDSAGSLKP
jgi:hypothetical protein